jgi:hypothetical protein
MLFAVRQQHDLRFPISRDRLVASRVQMLTSFDTLSQNSYLFDAAWTG